MEHCEAYYGWLQPIHVFSVSWWLISRLYQQSSSITAVFVISRVVITKFPLTTTNISDPTFQLFNTHYPQCISRTVMVTSTMTTRKLSEVLLVLLLTEQLSNDDLLNFGKRQRVKHRLIALKRPNYRLSFEDVRRHIWKQKPLNSIVINEKLFLSKRLIM